MSASTPPTGSFGRDAGMQTGKAIVLVLIAVVIGLLLLNQVPKAGGREAAGATSVNRPQAGGAPPAKHKSTSTTTTSTTTTTVPSPAPSTLKVVVLNACGLTGVAGDYSTELASDGYHVLPANNATSNLPSSQIYVVSSAGAAGAAALARTLGLSSSAIVAAPVPTTAPVPSVYVQTAGMVDLIVAIGPDLGKTAPTTTTTVAG